MAHQLRVSSILFSLVHSIAQPSFVHVSLSISEVSCIISLFFCWGAKRYFLPTSYENVGGISLSPTCLLSFIHPSI